MTVGKRIKTAAAGALLASLAGCLVLLLASVLRSITVICLIICAVIFVIAFVLMHILEGKPSKVRIPVFIILAVIGICTVLSITVYDIGKKMVFRPNFSEDDYETLSDLKDEAVIIEADGLSGWRIPASAIPDDKPRRVILYFGGNGEDSSRKVLYILEHEELSFLHNTCDFIFIDYPSYGNSEGDLSEDLIEEFAVNAYDIVRSLDTTSQVTVLSYSLGNGPAVYLASREDADIDRLVLLAPYYSGYDLYNSVLNIFHGPLKLLVAYKMPVYRFAPDVRCKVTIIASADDEIIPISSSRALFTELTGSNADFITVEETGHNDMFEDENVLDALAGALEVN